MNQLSLFSRPSRTQQPICPSIGEQTGWRRANPLQVCQDVDVLASIAAYSYDVDNPAFAAYFLRRTGIDIAWAMTHGPRPEWSRFFLSAPWDEVEAWILTSQDYTYLATGRPVDDRCRRSTLLILKITRGKLQDCWEIFHAWGRLDA